MSSYRLLFLIAVSAAFVCQSCTYGGPARSLASVVASRANKIPRSIRAPFRNTEMMTARGFGKRSQHPGKFKEGGDSPWSPNNRDAKFLEDLGALDIGDTFEQIFNEQAIESFPIDWLAHEIAGNPMLAQAILQRFVDVNHDGVISTQELIGLSPPDVNENFLN